MTTPCTNFNNAAEAYKDFLIAVENDNTTQIEECRSWKGFTSYGRVFENVEQAAGFLYRFTEQEIRSLSKPIHVLAIQTNNSDESCFLKRAILVYKKENTHFIYDLKRNYEEVSKFFISQIGLENNAWDLTAIPRCLDRSFEKTIPFSNPFEKPAIEAEPTPIEPDQSSPIIDNSAESISLANLTAVIQPVIWPTALIASVALTAGSALKIANSIKSQKNAKQAPPSRIQLAAMGTACVASAVLACYSGYRSFAA